MSGRTKDKMKLIGCTIYVTLIIISLAPSQILATEKENTQVKVKFLGGVPIDSSLTKLVPEKDRQMIRLKENYLFPKSDLPQYDRVIYSSNGKHKVYYSFIREIKAEGAIDVFALDSANNVMWSITTYPGIMLSNNGRHIINPADYPARIYFYDIESSDKPLNELEYAKLSLSDNGTDVAVAEGSRVSLFRSDGTRIWTKELKGHSYYRVAISSLGSHIVSYGLLEDDRPILSFFEKDSEIIASDTLEKIIKLRQSAMSSDDGKYIVFDASSAILLYKTETGRQLWRFNLPSTSHGKYIAFDIIYSVSVSKGGRVVAVLIKPFEPEERENYVLFLNDQGEQIAEFIANDIQTGWKFRPRILFTDDGRYAIFNNRDERRIFQIIE
jgi:outer membrane protein assembly factor BamB